MQHKICLLIILSLFYSILNATELKGLKPQPSLTVYIVNKNNSNLQLTIRKGKLKTGERLMVRLFDPEESLSFRQYVEPEEVSEQTTLGDMEINDGVQLVEQSKKVDNSIFFQKKFTLTQKGIYQVRISSGTFNSFVDLKFDSEEYGLNFQNGFFSPWENVPNEMYLYITPRTEKLMISKPELTINGQTGKSFDMAEKVGQCVKTSFPNPKKFRFTAWGMPVILCNNIQVAESIKGSVFINKDGLLFAWKFQDQIHQLIKKYADKKYVGEAKSLLCYDFSKYKNIYAQNPEKYFYLFDAYGALFPSINACIESQNIDPKSLYCGTINALETKPYDINIEKMTGGAAIGEKLAAAALLNDKGNPFYGQKELLYRAALWALRDLCTISEAEILPNSLMLKDPYPGFMAFIAGQRIFPAYGLAAPHMPEDIKKLWLNGLEHIADRHFSDGLVSCRNQSSHYLKAYQALADGSKLKRHQDMAKNYVSRFKKGTSSTGYQYEQQGPDGSYGGMNHYFMATYYIMSNDPIMGELLKKAYQFFNYFLVVEPNNSLISGFNYNHRLGQGPENEQWSGAVGIVNDIPEIAVRVQYKVASKNKNLIIPKHNIQKISGLSYSFSLDRFLQYSKEQNLNGYILPSERKENFIENINNEVIAIKTDAYYTAIFLGHPAPGKHYIKNREVLRKKDAKIVLRRCAPYLGGGMSILGSKPYGASILSTSWGPLYHNGVVAEKDNLYYTEDYFSTSFNLDKEAKTLNVYAKLEKYGNTLNRKYKFNSDSIEVTVKVTGNGDFEKLYEVIPIANGKRESQGVTISQDNNTIKIRDKHNKGINIQFDSASKPQIIEGNSLGSLRIDRLEIPLNLNQELKYTITF